jgi:hypothetical protein
MLELVAEVGSKMDLTLQAVLDQLIKLNTTQDKINVTQGLWGYEAMTSSFHMLSNSLFIYHHTIQFFIV